MSILGSARVVLSSEDVPRFGLQRSVTPFRQSTVTQSENGVMTVEGTLVNYGSRLQNGFVWVPGAGRDSILALKQSGNPLPMGYQHTLDNPLTIIGRWTEVTDRADSVQGVGRISDTSDGRDVSTLIRDEAINGISVGFTASMDDSQVLMPKETVTFQTPYGPFTHTADRYEFAVVHANISEASIVAEPADDDARVGRFMQSMFTKADKALPGLRVDSNWPDTAYSMALLMGGRGAAAFADLPEFEHHTLYQRLAKAYQRLGKTPPTYERAPEYKRVQFAHDERAVFQDRYLRKGLASVASGAAGFEGPLSHETRAEAERAVHALQGLIVRPRDTRQAALLAEIQALNADLASLKHERTK